MPYGLYQKRANSKSKVVPENFDEIKGLDVQSVIEMEYVPPSLVVNWDHTAMKIVPFTNWTMKKKGTRRVEIAGIDDKMQITAVFVCAMSGKFLPMQLIYKGTTSKCLPKLKDKHFPSDWHVTYTANHWANETTTIAYLQKVVIPYIERERERLKLEDTHCAFVLFDVFKGQCTAQVLELLEANSILFVTFPSSCTARLQPLDLSVNKPAKEFVRAKFRDWYGSKICKQLDECLNEEVDMKMSTMKPITAQWMIDLHAYLSSPPSIIVNGF